MTPLRSGDQEVLRVVDGRAEARRRLAGRRREEEHPERRAASRRPQTTPSRRCAARGAVAPSAPAASGASPSVGRRHPSVAQVEVEHGFLGSGFCGICVGDAVAARDSATGRACRRRASSARSGCRLGSRKYSCTCPDGSSTSFKPHVSDARPSTASYAASKSSIVIPRWWRRAPGPSSRNRWSCMSPTRSHRTGLVEGRRRDPLHAEDSLRRTESTPRDPTPRC